MRILFVGMYGVPFLKRASDVRMLSFANLFSSLDYNVTILNRYSPGKALPQIDMHVDSNIQIDEIIKKRNHKFLETILYLISILIEPIKIVKLNKVEKIDILNIYSGHYLDIVFYSLIKRIIKAKIVYHYVEYRSAFHKSSIYHKINSYLVDKYGPKFFDGAVCISNFLENKVAEINPNATIIKVPPVCDFKYIESIQSDKSKFGCEPYLVFCGSVYANEVINLILESYNHSKISQQVNLKMVLYGNHVKFAQWQEKHPNVEFYQKLDYNDLIMLFKGATGLFIPLRNTVQDKARFPNKICEYAATRGVIITTNNGEIPFYFKDLVDAIIAEDFQVDAMSKKLDWLADNFNCLEYIRANVLELGYQHFNIEHYKLPIVDFIQDLNS